MTAQADQRVPSRFRRSVRMVVPLLLLAMLPNPLRGDSPLTSTDFYRVYLDLPGVQEAAQFREMSDAIAARLSDPAVPIDHRAALVNALSWNLEGSDHAGALRAYWRDAGLDPDSMAATPHGAFALGYLVAMDTYMQPSGAVPLLRTAREAMPASFTVAMITALVEAQLEMDSSWCAVWQSGDAVLSDSTLTPDMVPEARTVIVDYLVLYQPYCAEGSDTPVTATDPCGDAATQTELNDCAESRYAAAEQELASVVTVLTEMMPDGVRERFEDDQAAWASERDAACRRANADVRGGTIYAMRIYDCMTERTRARIAELRARMGE